MSESFVCTRTKFAEWVRDSLNRLYDSAYLQTHPLAALLVDKETGALHRSQGLRRALLEAIRAMRPGPGVPANSPDWRAYRILELRYIEGQSPSEAMKQLALGKSQFFRDQARVLEALTAFLWDRWEKVHNVTLASATPDSEREELVRAEVERLYAHAVWEEVDAIALLNDLRTVVDPLAKANQVSMHLALSHDLVLSRASRVMLRQAMLNMLTYALDIGRGGQVDVSSFAVLHEMGVSITARAVAETALPLEAARHGDVGLDICRQLMTAVGGALYLDAVGREQWNVRLVWPVSVPRTLLVVDDNQGLIDLFRRYLAGHAWQVVGVTSGVKARQVLAEIQPAAIVLDVMMPEEDGWELLMAFQNDASARNIPVIICSVLDEPQLALSLGAAAYLQKPVTQQVLLSALTRVSASLAPTR